MKRTIREELKETSSQSDDDDSYKAWNCSFFPPTICSMDFGGRRGSSSSLSVVPSKHQTRSDATLPRPPTTQTRPSGLTQGEQLLANDMKQLSLDKREEVFEDIHGVMEVKRETPQLLRASLHQLELCLSSLRKNREGYDKATFLNPAYTRDEKLRTMFLRATQFDAAEAATRLCEHYEIKQKLFGTQRLVRDITWDDLPEDAQRSLNNGAYQSFADWKDRSGRVVSCDVWANWRYKTVESQVQGMWWISMHLMRQLYDQGHHMGVVLIPFTLGLPPRSSSYYMRAAALSKYKIGTCFPIRVSGFHGCFESDGRRPFFSALMSVLPKEIRLRTKMHFGSLLECQYALSSFGIDASFVDLVMATSHDDYDPGNIHDDQNRDPNIDEACDSLEQMAHSSSNGTANNIHVLHQRILALRQWEQQRRQHLEMTEPNVIRWPESTDVVLGRGVPYQKFPGNTALAQLLDQDVHAYTKAKTRKEKARITETIIQQVEATGGRFLKRDESGAFWSVVDREIARQKVAMGYRNLARRDRGNVAKTKAVATDPFDKSACSRMEITSDGTSSVDESAVGSTCAMSV